MKLYLAEKGQGLAEAIIVIGILVFFLFVGVPMLYNYFADKYGWQKFQYPKGY